MAKSILAGLILLAVLWPVCGFAGGTTSVELSPATFNLKVSLDSMPASGVTGDRALSVKVTHSDPPSGIFQSCDKVRSVMAIVHSFNPSYTAYQSTISTDINGGKGFCSFNPGDAPLNGNIIGPEEAFYSCSKAGERKALSKRVTVQLYYNNGQMESFDSYANVNIDCQCRVLKFVDDIRIQPFFTGRSYNDTISNQTTIGYAPIRFELAGGSLPNGLTMSQSGQLTGTPTVSNMYTFTVKATDSCPLGPQTAQKTYTLPACPALTTVQWQSSLPDATVREPYSYQLAPSGSSALTYRTYSSPPYSPEGLTLNSSGLISGTPTKAGHYNYDIVADTACNSASMDDRSKFGRFSIDVKCPALAISSPGDLFFDPKAGPYSYQITTSGGQTPVQFSLAAGSLPPGFTLSPTGVISGSYGQPGTSYTFTVSATDSCYSKQYATKQFTLTVAFEKLPGKPVAPALPRPKR
jgi:hypothetical protein